MYWTSAVKIFIYTIALVVLQAQWIARLPHPGLRADVLLPLMFGVAAECSPVMSLVWALVWGYALDTLSGKFYGFHVGSYVLAVCLVKVGAERLELQNPIYQMTFVGICALAQSFALWIFLCFDSMDTYGGVATWLNSLFRCALTTLVAPLVIYPVYGGERSP